MVKSCVTSKAKHPVQASKIDAGDISIIKAISLDGTSKTIGSSKLDKDSVFKVSKDKKKNKPKNKKQESSSGKNIKIRGNNKEIKKNKEGNEKNKRNLIMKKDTEEEDENDFDLISDDDSEGKEVDNISPKLKNKKENRKMAKKKSLVSLLIILIVVKLNFLLVMTQEICLLSTMIQWKSKPKTRKNLVKRNLTYN